MRPVVRHFRLVGLTEPLRKPNRITDNRTIAGMQRKSSLPFSATAPLPRRKLRRMIRYLGKADQSLPMDFRTEMIKDANFSYGFDSFCWERMRQLLAVFVR